MKVQSVVKCLGQEEGKKIGLQRLTNLLHPYACHGSITPYKFSARSCIQSNVPFAIHHLERGKSGKGEQLARRDEIKYDY